MSFATLHTLFDYNAASAVTVNDFPAPELCPAFAQDIALPHWSMREPCANRL